MKVLRILIIFQNYLLGFRQGRSLLTKVLEQGKPKMKLEDCHASTSSFSRKLVTRWSKQWFFKCVFRSAPASSGNLLEMQILGSPPGLPGAESDINTHFINIKFTRWFLWMLKFEKSFLIFINTKCVYALKYSFTHTVVVYGCENWTIKKAECRRIDAYELWCWTRLSRVPWTARRLEESLLKEISPEYT